jgi:basic amino acid/polyamine antiporter, APA family
VPVMSIVGVLSLIACVFMLWDYLRDPLSGITWKPEGGGGILFGSRSFDMFLLNIAILLSGLVIYLVARWVQRRRGVDLDAAYREIPIE